MRKYLSAVIFILIAAFLIASAVSLAGVRRMTKPSVEKPKLKVKAFNKIVEVHRVISGKAAYALGPNFYDNDWDAGDLDVLYSLPESDVEYLRSLTNLSSGVTYYIDLDGRTYNTTGFTNKVVHIGDELREIGDIELTISNYKEIQYNEIGYVYDYSPIILDLDGNNKVDVAYNYWLPHAPRFFDLNPRFFDISGDGIEDYVEWVVGPNDGLLVEPGVEKVTSALDLFGTAGGYEDGYAKLAKYDKDGNGWVEGPELKGFKIWIDRNMNAKCEDGELFPIEHFKITRLSVKHVNYVSRYYTADGKAHLMWDWWPAGIQLRRYR